MGCTDNMSYYKTIAEINESHHVTLVQHENTGKIYVKKVLNVYNMQIYQYLQEHHICGIPRIIDLYEDKNSHCLSVIEEYISGKPLQEIIDNREITFSSIVHYALELCTILEQLHTNNPPIIHRDIKPSNIIVTCCGHIMLLDFNAAKYYSENRSADTVLLGTQGYAAPEQYGFGASAPQTDIYALGILLREMANTLPKPVSQLNHIINQCTQLDPARRYRSASDLKEALCQMVKVSADVTVPKDTRHAFLPPGFRTKTPWKMFVATSIYIISGWLSLTLDIQAVNSKVLWLERLFCLIIILAVVFFTCNYRNIQYNLPLCRHPNRILHCVGIMIWNFIIIIILLTFMTMIESTLFS